MRYLPFRKGIVDAGPQLEKSTAKCARYHKRYTEPKEEVKGLELIVSLFAVFCGMHGAV